MAIKIQSLIAGFGKAKEAAYNTPSASFLRFSKINMSLASPNPLNETDRDWIGKASYEFAETPFKSHRDLQNTVQKYGSIEFMTYALAYALGNVAETTGTYTIKAQDPATSIQLPSFSVVEQVPEGGGMAIDNLMTGCVAESVKIDWAYGAGLKSVSTTLNYHGSGSVTTPSAITVPSLTVDHHALAVGITALTLNGVDYKAAATSLTGSFTWTNNHLLEQGYVPGGGTDADGYAVRSRCEYGKRTGTLEFTARLLHTSTEISLLKNLTSGTGLITFTYDGSHHLAIALAKLIYRSVENTETEGIVTVKVTAEVAFDGTDLITVTSVPGISGIAQ